MRLAASNDAPQALDGLLAPVVAPGAISFFARKRTPTKPSSSSVRTSINEYHRNML